MRWRRARWSALALQLLTPAIVQHDRVRLAAAYRRGTAVLGLLTFPIIIAAVLVLAPELVLALLGPAWVGVIVPLQILAPGVFFRMVFQVSDSLATATAAAYAIAWRQGRLNKNCRLRIVIATQSFPRWAGGLAAAFSMSITFLGTRGNIELKSRRHRRHSAILIQLGSRGVMVDCGADWLDRVIRLAPDAIVLTHAHADHAEGLRHGAPCPVYAPAATWDLIGGYPIRHRRTLAPRVPEEIAGLTFCACPVQHSLRCPAVGYRIGVGQAVFFYLPDVAAIPGHRELLAGSALFVGDGATITRPLLRRQDGMLLGHAPLGWCRDAGVFRAVFTYCGSEIVGGDERRLGARVRALARECGVSARIAYDGLEIRLP